MSKKRIKAVEENSNKAEGSPDFDWAAFEKQAMG